MRFLGSSDQRLVVGIDAHGEFRVALGVFMTATNQRVVRQRGELAQAREHFGSGAFDQPPASQTEEGVAGEQDRAAREEVIDLAAGMAWCVDDTTGSIAKL